MNATRLVGGLVLIAVLLCGAFGTVFFRQSLKWDSVHLSSQRLDDTVYLPPKLALRAGSLGYGSFWGDMMFIRTHAYFLRHMYGDRIMRWLDPYVDAVVALDPENPEIYYWASIVVRYGQVIDEQVIERSNRFAEEGVLRFPDDPRLYAHLGFNKYFELRPLHFDRERALQEQIGAATGEERTVLLQRLAEERAQRYQLEREALEDYTLAAMLPNSGIDPLFLVTLYVKQDDLSAATQLISQLYGGATSADRFQLLHKLELLGEGELAGDLRAQDQAHAASMPYVPEGLYPLLGHRSELTVPLTWNTAGSAIDQATEALRSREQNEGGTL